MDSDAILRRFDELSVWKQGDQRAPHKPLLVLYALGPVAARPGRRHLPRGRARADGPAREFGPPRKSDHPE